MNSANAQKDTLHGPWPSPIEELQALHGDAWEIYREIDTEGHHGAWVARRIESAADEPEELRADDVASLAEKLAAAAS